MVAFLQIGENVCIALHMHFKVSCPSFVIWFYHWFQRGLPNCGKSLSFLRWTFWYLNVFIFFQVATQSNIILHYWSISPKEMYHWTCSIVFYSVPAFTGGFRCHAHWTETRPFIHPARAFPGVELLADAAPFQSDPYTKCFIPKQLFSCFSSVPVELTPPRIIPLAHCEPEPPGLGEGSSIDFHYRVSSQGTVQPQLRDKWWCGNKSA